MAGRLVNVLLLILILIGVAQTVFATDRPPRLMVLGDSLTAGFGLPSEQAFPARLQASLRQRGMVVEVRDAGVSGDTTAGGLARLDWMLADHPDFVLVELGGNDALRGFDPDQTYANLDAIVMRLHAVGVTVLLAGMRAPPNLGRDYAKAFDAIFPRLARKHDIMLYPFFLDGVAGELRLNQADGIHPNSDGVDVIVERIRPYIMKLIAGKS